MDMKKYKSYIITQQLINNDYQTHSFKLLTHEDELLQIVIEILFWS